MLRYGLPILVVVVVACLVGGWLLARPRPVSGKGSAIGTQDYSLIEKGRRLMVAADCQACHTVPSSGRPFAGGRPIETPFGIVLAANITPDRVTGIGAWSDNEFDDALRKGRRRDGALLYPAMPYPSYTRLSADDVRAIRAYLNTVRPYQNGVESNQLPFPFDVRLSLYAWNALYFREGEMSPDDSKAAEWNRGAYLVRALGHCGACHTPRTWLGGENDARVLQGNPVQGWFAPDITNNNVHGLAKWTEDDIATYLKTGHNNLSAATGPMAEEIELSSSRMDGADLHAIAVYLKSQPGSDDQAPAPIAAGDPRMKAGAAIFHDTCSSCHGLNGEGTPKLFPAIAASPNVRSSDPATLIRLVLRGTRSVATASEPTAPVMPSFAWQLNDDQIAAVLTYVRNAWPPAAPALSAGDVAEARRSLAGRAE
jgi:mono/diheme cytochrome c family protein